MLALVNIPVAAVIGFTPFRFERAQIAAVHMKNKLKLKIIEPMIAC